MRRDSDSETEVTKTPNGETRRVHRTEKIGGDWVTRGLVAAVLGLIGWYGLDVREALKVNADAIVSNSKAIVAMQNWQAETRGNRWTTGQQSEFQVALFAELADDRREFYERIDRLIGELHDHEENDHPPDHVEKRLDRLERMAEDVAEIKGILQAEREARRSRG